MPVTKDELDHFHQFAANTIQHSEAEVSWDDLFIRWQSSRERSDINSAIREGLADVDAGRFRPATEAMEEIRKEFGFRK